MLFQFLNRLAGPKTKEATNEYLREGAGLPDGVLAFVSLVKRNGNIWWEVDTEPQYFRVQYLPDDPWDAVERWAFLEREAKKMRVYLVDVYVR